MRVNNGSRFLLLIMTLFSVFLLSISCGDDDDDDGEDGDSYCDDDDAIDDDSNVDDDDNDDGDDDDDDDCLDDDDDTVIVDFSREEAVPSLSGFLGTLDFDRVWDEFLVPLEAKYYRGFPPSEEALARAESLGIQYLFVVSDAWGYPPGQEPPYADYSAWEELVRSVARQYGTRVVYDIWNEPDIHLFWWLWPGATYEKFLETFRRAHDVIREELGDEAIISGPSISFFSMQRLRRFADFCRDHGLKVQILSFHLLYQPDSLLPAVEEKIRQAREKFVDNPEYASVGFEELHVNEYLMAYKQNVRPGSVLAFLRHMERAEVDGACKACWPHPDDCDGLLDCYLGGSWTACGDGSMTGILTPDQEPRAVWWAYKHYADGVTSRVRATSSDRRIMALASRESEDPHTAQVLIAHYGDGIEEALSTDISLHDLSSLSFVGSDDTHVSVTVKRMPFIGNGSEPVWELPVVAEYPALPIECDRAAVTVDQLQPYEVYVVSIKRTDQQVCRK
jgi:xylan 1,4-beta-xylosidase